MSQPTSHPEGDPTDRMRASDSDRQSIIDQLSQAYASGQLDLDEFTERTAHAQSARTYGELQPLTVDLPGAAPARPPVAAAQSGTAQPATAEPALAGVAQHYRSKGELKSAARHGDPEAARKIFYGVLSFWVFMSAICTVIWFVGDHEDGDGFWPVWVMIGLGFGVFGAFRNWKMK